MAIHPADITVAHTIEAAMFETLTSTIGDWVHEFCGIELRGGPPATTAPTDDGTPSSGQVCEEPSPALPARSMPGDGGMPSSSQVCEEPPSALPVRSVPGEGGMPSSTGMPALPPPPDLPPRSVPSHLF
jgi:hypothetical protein